MLEAMLIDLSVPLNEGTPVYPGDPATEIRAVSVLERDGFLIHSVCCGTHLGTHVDAPSHMLAGGRNLHEIPLAQFVGSAICVGIGDTFTLEAVRSAPLRREDIVFFYTGMDARYGDPSYFQEYPALTPEVAHYLVEKGVKLVGTDTCSPDPPGPPFPAHQILLGGDVLIIENLTNLEQVVGKRFEVYAFPAKYELDAAPVRVIARI